MKNCKIDCLSFSKNFFIIVEIKYNIDLNSLPKSLFFIFLRINYQISYFKPLTLISILEKFKMIYDEKCPSGKLAAGKLLGDYFAVTFAKKCSDLMCPYGYRCHQIHDDLAKCCEISSSVVSKDQPLNSGSTRIGEKCPSIERRLVKTCGQILTDMVSKKFLINLSFFQTIKFKKFRKLLDAFGFLHVLFRLKESFNI